MDMTQSATNAPLRKAALFAGFGLMIMTIFAISALYFVFPQLIVPGDTVTTVNNIMTDQSLFSIGIACLVMVAIFDLVVAKSLYLFLKPVNQRLSLLAVGFRVIYTVLLCIALLNYVDVLQLLNNAESSEIGQLQTHVMQSISAFDYGWSIGLVFFSLHLMLIGYLFLKSDYVPKLLAVVMLIVGLAYLIDNIRILFIPDYNLGIATYLGWGELFLMSWLLTSGGKHQSVMTSK